MSRLSQQVCFFAALVSAAVMTSGEAKVLRNNSSSSAVLVFKGAGALSRFESLTNIASRDESLLSPLLTCKVPQGSKIEVLGSGRRTAFVRVLEGSTAGSEGTAPIGTVRDP
jgi:hypothetical protein